MFAGNIATRLGLRNLAIRCRLEGHKEHVETINRALRIPDAVEAVAARFIPKFAAEKGYSAQELGDGRILELLMEWFDYLLENGDEIIALLLTIMNIFAGKLVSAAKVVAVLIVFAFAALLAKDVHAQRIIAATPQNCPECFAKQTYGATILRHVPATKTFHLASPIVELTNQVCNCGCGGNCGGTCGCEDCICSQQVMAAATPGYQSYGSGVGAYRSHVHVRSTNVPTQTVRYYSAPPPTVYHEQRTYYQPQVGFRRMLLNRRFGGSN